MKTNNKLEEVLSDENLKKETNKLRKEGHISLLGSVGAAIALVYSAVVLYPFNPEVGGYVAFGSILSGTALLLHAADAYSLTDSKYEMKRYLERKYQD